MNKRVRPWQYISALLFVVSMLTCRATYAADDHTEYAADDHTDEVIDFEFEGSNAALFQNEIAFLESNGAQVNMVEKRDLHGLGPAGVVLVTLAGSAAICVLAQAITRLLHELHTGGLGISITDGNIEVRERPEVEKGCVRIRMKDGTRIEKCSQQHQSLCNILTDALRST
ncbi:MAG TPA: hypothetical protein PK224_03750 [Nitrospira sp.]|nr:hypothetical protein [Nitrospira sp.]